MYLYMLHIYIYATSCGCSSQIFCLLIHVITAFYQRGHQELQAVSAAIQTVVSTPVSVTTALKGIQKTLGKALPFKVWRHSPHL